MNNFKSKAWNTVQLIAMLLCVILAYNSSDVILQKLMGASSIVLGLLVIKNLQSSTSYE